MNVTRKLSLCAIALTAAFALPSAAQELKMMTGPQGGSWYPLGGAIQGLLEKNIPGVKMSVAPGAGISNVLGVQTGKADLGFGNASSTYDGAIGRDPFKQKTANVCHVATLYFQYFHMVALADAGIKNVGDATGKALTTQQKGNTGEQMTRDVLKLYGLDHGKSSFDKEINPLEETDYFGRKCLVARRLLQLGLVDAVEVAIIPVLLGGGVPLLPHPATTAKLELTKHRVYDKTGTVALEYSVV